MSNVPFSPRHQDQPVFRDQAPIQYYIVQADEVLYTDAVVLDLRGFQTLRLLVVEDPTQPAGIMSGQLSVHFGIQVGSPVVDLLETVPSKVHQYTANATQGVWEYVFDLQREGHSHVAIATSAVAGGTIDVYYQRT